MSDSAGGVRANTHSKIERPIESSKPLHVCIRSQHARGAFTMQGRHRLKIDGIVESVSKKMSVRVLRYANVGNHLHLVVKLPGRQRVARKQYAAWIRGITGLIAFHLGKDAIEAAQANEAAKARFWDARPFTRVVRGRSGWKVIDRYVMKNEFEAAGYPAHLAKAMAREHFESAQCLALQKWRPEKSNPTKTKWDPHDVLAF